MTLLSGEDDFFRPLINQSASGIHLGQNNKANLKSHILTNPMHISCKDLNSS
jgi:hypothetical protein